MPRFWRKKVSSPHFGRATISPRLSGKTKASDSPFRENSGYGLLACVFSDYLVTAKDPSPCPLPACAAEAASAIHAPHAASARRRPEERVSVTGSIEASKIADFVTGNRGSFAVPTWLTNPTTNA